MKTIKAYIVYGGSEDWLDARLVLENGWAPFQHICSDVNFMAGDLIEQRRERKAVFAAMGYEVEIIGYPQRSPGPAGLLEKHKDKTNWEAFAKEYEEMEARLSQPSAV